MIISSPLIHLNNYMMFLKVCYNQSKLNITLRLLILINQWATRLLLNTNVWITFKKYQHAGKCDDQNEFKIFSRLLWFLLHKKCLMTVLVCLWPKWHPRNQVLVNYCVYSPTYLMLKGIDPLNMDVACEKIKQNGKGIQKSMIILNVSFIHG